MKGVGRTTIGPRLSEQPIDRNGHFPRMIGGRVCVGTRINPLLPEADPERIFLSPMQQVVLKAVAENETAMATAIRFKISPKTVEYHRACMMKRLGVQGTAALTKCAVKIGLSKIDEIAQ